MGGMLSGSSRTVEASSLKTGDLLLICLPKLTSFGLAPPDMVRGLMGAQKGTFTNDDEKAFSMEDVNRLVNTRIKALMVSIEKLKMFLRNQNLEMRNEPPLKLLKDEDLIEFLWAGKHSIASRYVQL